MRHDEKGVVKGCEFVVCMAVPTVAAAGAVPAATARTAVPQWMRAARRWHGTMPTRRRCTRNFSPNLERVAPAPFGPLHMAMMRMDRAYVLMGAQGCRGHKLHRTWLTHAGTNMHSVVRDGLANRGPRVVVAHGSQTTGLEQPGLVCGCCGFMQSTCSRELHACHAAACPFLPWLSNCNCQIDCPLFFGSETGSAAMSDVRMLDYPCMSLLSNVILMVRRSVWGGKRGAHSLLNRRVLMMQHGHRQRPPSCCQPDAPPLSRWGRLLFPTALKTCSASGKPHNNCVCYCYCGSNTIVLP